MRFLFYICAGFLIIFVMAKHNVTYYLQRLPIYSATAATVICGFLTFGEVPEWIKIAYELCVISYGYWVLHKFIKVLKLCFVVRSGMYYTYAFFLCLWLRRYPAGQAGLFGRYLSIAQAIMFAIGCCHLSYFAYKKHKGELNC